MLPVVSLPPLVPLISGDTGLSPAFLGQILTVMLAASAGALLVAGPIADRYGMRRVMLAGGLAAAACFITLGGAPTLAGLAAGALFGSLANGSLPGLSLAVARSSLAGSQRVLATGWSAAGPAIAAIAGAPILTALAAVIGWRQAFVTGGVIVLLATLLMRALLPPPPASRQAHPGGANLIAAYRSLFGSRRVRWLLAATLARAIGWFGHITFCGSMLAEVLGLSATSVAVVFTVSSTGYLAGSLAASRIIQRAPLALVAATANVVSALGIFIIYAVNPGPGTLIVMPLVSASAAVAWVGVVTMLGNASPGGAGTTMAMNGALFSLGGAGGGAVAGLLIVTSGFAALGWVLPGFVVVASAFILMAADRQPATAPGASTGPRPTGTSPAD
jgi:DHA1 family bicyclomycin/chloramphenicol resistance-like MFS transporter